MKKSILATLGGIVLGIVLMIGVFFILNMKPVNEDMMAQTTVQNDNEKNDNEKNDVVSDKTEKVLSADENGRLPMGTILELKNDEVEEEVHDDQSNPASAPAQSKLPYYIKVNRMANCVTVYTLDENGNYTVPIKAMVCSVGTNESTPLGVSEISDKYTWRLLFGNTYGQYSVRFNGHILFHSVPYMSPSNSTLKEGQFNLLGQPASQGCIRLCVADAKWIYDNCAKGTIVEVYDSLVPGPLGKPSMPQISENSPFKGWDPTDPNPSNPWLYGVVAIHGVEDITLNAGETIDLLEGVSATDVDGLEIDVVVSGDVDYDTAGKYVVTYSATGVLGNTETATATVTILNSETEISKN